jgi:isocitrate lyase
MMLSRNLRQSAARRLPAAKPTLPLQPLRLLSTTSRRPIRLAGPTMAPAATPRSFQLLPEPEKAGAAEDALFEAQVAEIEAWWRSPRFEGIKRPYSAADVATKRGTQEHVYPSSVMARKLFNLIQERLAQGAPIHTSTFGNPETGRGCV